ncbi:unnamed protein product [Coffea canephora]|uniref:R13L1/DRL21-like LRR repeat region domain-containing protein n=1 Tax=Coffea canephora TaxID=49390 RepID=A0A068V7R0_COFCA|nr:unnamed protein product [Coffea canephora]
MYRLVFEWGNRYRGSDNCDEDVLEGLQPHPNLKELQILKFMGDQFPQWFMNLTSLVELRVADCTRCRELPTLGQLSSLQHLYLTGLENIRSIGLSFYSTTLKKLSLEGMKNLEEWKDAPEMMSTAGEVHVMDVFPMLEKLSIRDCPRLTTIPTPSRFPSLDVLEIEENCHVLLAEKVLTNITTLCSLDLRGAQRLNFDWALGLASSSSLRHVSLRGMYGAKSLPHQLQCLTTITSLSLFGFGAIEALPDWLGNLASLDELILHYCPNLEYLPSVDAMERLKLRRLEIEDCPLLKRRCTPQSGSEWPKISNIPEHRIDFRGTRLLLKL